MTLTEKLDWLIDTPELRGVPLIGTGPGCVASVGSRPSGAWRRVQSGGGMTRNHAGGSVCLDCDLSPAAALLDWPVT